MPEKQTAADALTFPDRRWELLTQPMLEEERDCFEPVAQLWRHNTDVVGVQHGLCCLRSPSGSVASGHTIE